MIGCSKGKIFYHTIIIFCSNRRTGEQLSTMSFPSRNVTQDFLYIFCFIISFYFWDLDLGGLNYFSFPNEKFQFIFFKQTNIHQPDRWFFFFFCHLNVEILTTFLILHPCAWLSSRQQIWNQSGIHFNRLQEMDWSEYVNSAMWISC